MYLRFYLMDTNFWSLVPTKIMNSQRQCMPDKMKKKPLYDTPNPCLFKSIRHLLGIIVSVRRMRGTLGTVQPFDMPEASADLSVLELGTCQLLLLPGAELHGRIVGVGLHGRAGRGVAGGADIAAWDCAGDCARDSRIQSGCARVAVLESVEADGEVALGGQTTGIDVPLFGAEGADEFFVVGDHDDTALVVTDGDGETADRVTVQEVGGLVEDEEMGVVLEEY